MSEVVPSKNPRNYSQVLERVSVLIGVLPCGGRGYCPTGSTVHTSVSNLKFALTLHKKAEGAAGAESPLVAVPNRISRFVLIPIFGSLSAIK